MQRSRRQRKSRRLVGVCAAVVPIVAIGGWLYFRGGRNPTAAGPPPTAVAATDRPAPRPQPASDPPKPASHPAAPAAEPKTPATKPSAADGKLVANEQVIIPGPDTKPAPTVPAAPFQFKPSAAPDSNDPPQEPATTAPREHPGAADDPTASRATSDARSGNRAIDEARKLLDGGKPIEARHALNALLKRDLSETESTEVRALLTRLADDTIFSRRSAADDPLIDTYTVQSGDVLITIAKKYDVPHEVLMLVNGITNAASLRPDQKLKVPRGPFHVRIYKSKFRMDVYLQDLYLRSFRVGLGSENGTPEGTWKVKNRLTNPTYFPPASAPIKRVIPPDDPANPLGEFWIGLQGVEGPAVGHEGFGIHGTIEPESIGKAVSLGCVRMHNEDVAVVYKLLAPGHATVTILP